MFPGYCCECVCCTTWNRKLLESIWILYLKALTAGMRQQCIYFFPQTFIHKLYAIHIFDVMYYSGILTFGSLRWNSRTFHQAGGMQKLIVVCLSECSNMVSNNFCFCVFLSLLRGYWSKKVICLVVIKRLSYDMTLPPSSIFVRIRDVHYNACWSLFVFPGEMWSPWWPGHKGWTALSRSRFERWVTCITTILIFHLSDFRNIQMYTKFDLISLHVFIEVPMTSFQRIQSLSL